MTTKTMTHLPSSTMPSHPTTRPKSKMTTTTNFALAFGIAFLLWRDMENGADKEGDEGDGRMGDWFLCLTARGTTTTDDVFDTSDNASVDGGGA